MFDSLKTITCIESYTLTNSNFENTNPILYDEVIPIAHILSCLNNLQSCAYINTSITNHPQISLLEQLFLRTNLKKEYPYIHIDYYFASKNNHLTRGIVSQAEFQNLESSKLLQYLRYYRYNYIIFDNLTFDSPYFSQIEKVLKDEQITSKIIFLSSSKVRSYFSKIISNFYVYQENNNLLPKHSVSGKLGTNINYYLNCPINMSVWLQIAYNFKFLKLSEPKRFFFISTQLQNSREMTFIYILKKSLKDMHEFGNWDFMSINLEKSKFDNTSEEPKELQLCSLMEQSAYLNGFTNIITSSQDLAKKIYNLTYERESLKNVSTLIWNLPVDINDSTKENIQLLDLSSSSTYRECNQ